MTHALRIAVATLAIGTLTLLPVQAATGNLIGTGGAARGNITVTAAPKGVILRVEATGQAYVKPYAKMTGYLADGSAVSVGSCQGHCSASDISSHCSINVPNLQKRHGRSVALFAAASSCKALAVVG